MELSPALLVTAEEVFGLGVTVGAAGNEIDPDEDDEGDDEDGVSLPPLFPEVAQKARPAGAAVVAQL